MLPGTNKKIPLAFLILLPLLLPACKAPERPVGAGGDPTVHLSQADEALAKIARDAREGLPGFLRRAQRPQLGDGNFRVKYPFNAESGSGFSHEQIWLADISFQDGQYYGVPSNTPYYAAGLKAGDRVLIDIEGITDWMYTRNGVIEGGLSIKYLLEQIPEPDRDDEQRAFLKMFR
jgi:uncharacterized protein YegJ (DUF2314 family)